MCTAAALKSRIFPLSVSLSRFLSLSLVFILPLSLILARMLFRVVRSSLFLASALLNWPTLLPQFMDQLKRQLKSGTLYFLLLADSINLSFSNWSLTQRSGSTFLWPKCKKNLLGETFRLWIGVLVFQQIKMNRGWGLLDYFVCASAHTLELATLTKLHPWICQTATHIQIWLSEKNSD